MAGRSGTEFKPFKPFRNKETNKETNKEFS